MNVAVIGAGIYGTNLLKAFEQFEREGNCRLVALADRESGVLDEHTRAFGIRGYEDYRTMLKREELDAVAIATPDFAHREMAVEVLGAGKHLLLEKPMDTEVGGCLEIMAAAEEHDVLLELDFHKRYDPANLELREAVAAGRLGRIQYGYCWVEDTIEVPRAWLGWADRSSPAWFIGVHAYDLMRWITGQEPVRVWASGVKDRLVALGIDTYDSLQARVEFDGGAAITFDASWILPEGFPSIINQGLRLVGSEGIWEIDSQDRGIEYVAGDQDRLMTSNPYFLREEQSCGRGIRYAGYGVRSVRAFLERVLFLEDGGCLVEIEGRYPSGYDGLQATRIAQAVHESAATGEICTIDGACDVARGDGSG